MKRLVQLILPLFCASLTSTAYGAEQGSILSALDESLGLYQAEFAAEEGRPVSDEVLGFEWQSSDAESLIRIFEVKGPGLLGAEVYGCHEHDSQAHCDYEESKPAQAYAVPPRNFQLTEVRTAFEEALKLIATRIVPLNEVSSVKIWQDGHDLQVLAQSARGVSALMCHHHHGALDCHRQRQVGAGEPQF